MGAFNLVLVRLGSVKTTEPNDNFPSVIICGKADLIHADKTKSDFPNKL